MIDSILAIASQVDTALNGLTSSRPMLGTLVLALFTFPTLAHAFIWRYHNRTRSAYRSYSAFNTIRLAVATAIGGTVYGTTHSITTGLAVTFAVWLAITAGNAFARRNVPKAFEKGNRYYCGSCKSLINEANLCSCSQWSDITRKEDDKLTKIVGKYWMMRHENANPAHI